jgi:hypothetical protein
MIATDSQENLLEPAMAAEVMRHPIAEKPAARLSSMDSMAALADIESVQ